MVCRTVKKGLVGAGLGALALFVLFGTSAPSYFRTVVSRVRQGAQDAVPIRFEIDRARQEIAALEPAIHDNIEALANAEVDVKALENEIAATEVNLDREGKEMVALNNSLKAGRDVLTSSGTSYSPEEIKADLARRFDSYQRGKQILADKKETLKIRQQNVLAAKKTLNEMAAQKKALAAKVEGIEARLRQIEATQATNEFTFDDTALARVKQTVADLDRKLEVKARVVEQEGRYAEKGIPVPVEPSRDVSQEIETEFGSSHHSADKSL
jgi:septal ring factor EnvC (AmiA/AmiB activator)